MIRSGMLSSCHLGVQAAAVRVEQVIVEIVAEDKEVSYDLNPECNDPTVASISQVADAIIEILRSNYNA
jgi:hypothetical protein